MDISLSLKSALTQTGAIQDEFKQLNEAVSKIEHKNSSLNQRINLKSCTFIDKKCLRVTH